MKKALGGEGGSKKSFEKSSWVGEGGIKKNVSLWSLLFK
jgi:hypothetical protein